MSEALLKVHSNISPITKSMLIGSLGVTAGFFDETKLAEFFTNKLPKLGPHVKIQNGQIIQSLVMQFLNVPHQSLYGTAEFFTNIAIGALLNAAVTEEDLGRAVISRMLDNVAAYGSEKLFIEASAYILKQLGVDVTEVHLDSTSIHYHGESQPSKNLDFVLARGYSRDDKPDLKQANVLAIVDAFTKLPIYERNVSGNVSDNKSFNELFTNGGWELLKEQFTNIKYLVADSAACTSDIVNNADGKVFLVTRVPDKLTAVKDVYSSLNKTTLTDVYPNDPESPKGKWIDNIKVGDHELKCMVICNENLKAKKENTIAKRADKELDTLTKAIKKLRTQPCKCQADAKASVQKLINSSQYCTITNVAYEEVKRATTRGRTKKGEKREMVVVAVKVTADIAIDQTLVSKKVDEEILYVIGTTDTNRKWTMYQLLATYKRQSTVERAWRCCKDPKFFIDSLYLESPERIDALLWIKMIALLVYATIEYKLRATMKKNNLTLPAPDKKSEQDQPTMMRFLQYLSNSNINLIYRGLSNIEVSYIPNEIIYILNAFGGKYCKYFNADTYLAYMQNEKAIRAFNRSL